MNLIRVKGPTVTHVAHWAVFATYYTLCSRERVTWPDHRIIEADEPTPSPICKNCRRVLPPLIDKVDKWDMDPRKAR